MTITHGYATLKNIKDRLGIEDYEDDPKLESVVEAASRWIDRYLDRRFFAATETRYYTPTNGDYIIVDDLLSVTTLKTDSDGDGTYETTWTTNDYRLRPRNALLDGEPYRMIYRSPNGSYYFPTVADAVQIAGSFGYSSTAPKAIEEACILATLRIWERRHLIFGTAGNADLGTVEAIIPLSKDGELMALLGTFSRKWVSVRPV